MTSMDTAVMHWGLVFSSIGFGVFYLWEKESQRSFSLYRYHFNVLPLFYRQCCRDGADGGRLNVAHKAYKDLARS